VVRHNWLKRVSYACFTDVYVIIKRSCHYRDEVVAAFVHPFSGFVGKDLVLLDGNARPHRAWVFHEYIDGERNKMYGLAWPFFWSLFNKACMGQTPTTNSCSARCRMTSHTRLLKSGQDFLFLQSGNWFAALILCV